MEGHRKVLLVSYIFPPFPGVGGRRWAKFSRELAKRDYEVFVVATQNPFKTESQWMEDIRHDRIHVEYIPMGFPKDLLIKPKSLR